MSGKREPVENASKIRYFLSHPVEGRRRKYTHITGYVSRQRPRHLGRLGIKFKLEPLFAALERRGKEEEEASESASKNRR